MKSMETKLWFKAKGYGWGWTPASWEGWLVLAAYAALLVRIFWDIDRVSHSASDTLIDFAPRFLLVTAVLYWICWVKGEKPRWRWGNKDEN